MIHKKTYYSISEVAKLLDIKEYTIRFWDSKLSDLSKRDNKGKTRFFNLKQIEKLSKLRDILKNNDSITLAYEVLSKNHNKKSILNLKNNDNFNDDSIKSSQNLLRIKNISKKLKNLLN